MQWQKKNEPPAGQRLPSGVPDSVLQLIATDAREFSRLLDELNRADSRADRRHDEAMDAIRNVIDEARDIKELIKRTTDAA